MPSLEEGCAEAPLGKLLTASGGGFHPDLAFFSYSGGRGIRATRSIPENEVLVRCPDDLVISPKSAEAAWQALGSDEELARSWTDHQVVCSYLAVQRDPMKRPSPSRFWRHGPYVDSLPGPESLRTPLYWAPAERSLLQGSNLSGAVEDREAHWRKEWAVVRETLDRLGHNCTWDDYLWACTMLSSRAYPSHVIESLPFEKAGHSMIHRPSTASSTADGKIASTPVLLPGMDAFDHQRGRPILWEHVNTCSQIRLRSSLAADGAKSSEELILGYGFVLDLPDGRNANPDDRVALKVARPPSVSPAARRLLADLPEGPHFLPRNGDPPPLLLAQIRILVASEQDLDHLPELNAAVGDVSESPLDPEVEETALWQLAGMLKQKLARLRQFDNLRIEPPARPEVQKMVDVYRRGQREILTASIARVESLHAMLEDAAAMALDRREADAMQRSR